MTQRIILKILPTPMLRVVRERAPVEPQGSTSHQGAKQTTRLKRFDAIVPLDIDRKEDGAKKCDPIRKEDRIVDYQNVVVKGYLSTFGNVDRDGDIVQPGAFKDTIERFKANPIMLLDHRNSVDTAVGQFTAMREDAKGLYMEAMLSNAPGLVDVRFKVVEGVLRSTSMGGIFHYDETGRNIFKVDLFEGSLVGIPANPMATISTREANDEDRKRLKMLSTQTTAKPGGE